MPAHKIAALRARMAEHGMHAYIVPLRTFIPQNTWERIFKQGVTLLTSPVPRARLS